VFNDRLPETVRQLEEIIAGRFTAILGGSECLKT
jgi:hypothetical protein